MVQSPDNPQPQRVPSLSSMKPLLLESILNSISDGVVIADLQGNYLFFNAAAERLLGAGPLDVPAEQRSAAYGFFLPDQTTPRPVSELPLARALRGEPAESVEVFVRNANVPAGAWMSTSGTPLRDASGRLTGGIVVFRDITASKRAEEAGRKQRDWAAAINDTIASLVLVLDRGGHVVSFNRACEVATGYASGEVRGRTFTDVFAIPDGALRLTQVLDSVRSAQFPAHCDLECGNKSGERRWIAWSSGVLTGAGGEVEYIIVTGIDITGRVLAERELQRVNDTLRAIIETSPLAIVTLDFDANVKTWNRAAETMFGWKEEEVVGKPFPIIPEEDEQFFRTNLARLRQGETIAGVARARRRRDGSLIDVSLWNAPQRDASGAIVGNISVIADMTEHRRLEEQFRQVQKMEAVGRLAGGVAHDFNNLLTVINGYTQMLLDGLEASSRLRPYVGEIVRASESAATLTNQLLAFSRRQIVSPQVLDLNTLIGGMEGMLHRLLAEDVELEIELLPELPRVRVDAGQFQQVLMNLVVNARDALPKGGRIVARTGIEVVESGHAEGVPPGSYVVLSVEDGGHGMSEDTRRRVFEPFFTTKSRGKGTGLGLSTVYGIVKQAGGEVTVESEPGMGTTFRVYLPPSGRAVGAGAEQAAPSSRARATETVLVVENEAGLRRLVRDILQRNGYTVLQAGNGSDAVELCRQHAGPLHLVIADLTLPGEGGGELAARLVALRPGIKVLFMSGDTGRFLPVDPAHGKPAPFLPKPFGAEALLTKVRQTLSHA